MTTQKVVCPTTMVQNERLIDQNAKNEFSAIPVMIPGSAIGRTKTNEIASRPKKRLRANPNAASEPSTSASAVATDAALTDNQSAPRTSESCQAAENQCVVKPGIGQLWTLDELNAYTAMIAIGSHRNATMANAHTDKPTRRPRLSIT